LDQLGAAPALAPASYSFGLSVPAAAVAAVGAYYNVDGAAPIHAWSAATGAASAAMTATALNITVESVRTPVLNAMAPATSTSPAAGVGERWDASGTGVAVETGDRTQTYTGSTGPPTATAAAPVDSVSHLVGLAPATGSSSLRYGFSGPGDSPSVVMDASSQPLERMAGLVGGVVLSRRAGSDAWSYRNVHGEVVATAGRWLNKNKWRIGGYAAGAVCTAASGGACVGALSVLLGAKTFHTINAGGGWRDHAWNVGSTAAWALPGFAAPKNASYLYRALLGTPDWACNSMHRCASPGWAF
jgi:hypothetical protein